MDGNVEHFERECTPQACQLNRLRKLPNIELWEWFLELQEWQKDGLSQLVTEVMKDMSVWHVRAFIAHQKGYLAAAEEERERAQRGQGGEG